MIINIERPVYERTLTGYVIQILSYDTENCTYKIRYLNKNEEKIVSASLDGENLSFSADGPWGFDPNIITYLYSLGVVRISSIPDSFYDLLEIISKAESLDKLFKGYKELLYVLLLIKEGHIHVDVEDDFIIDDDNNTLGKLCALALIIEDKPNRMTITDLKKYGFRAFPLKKDSEGWILGGLDIGKGIIKFG